MKKGLLGTTALVGATALLAGAAGAAEAPSYKISGGTNFQFYYIDQDATTFKGGTQDHGWYFGVDSSEIKFDVSGTADNGLNYGYKVEIDTNTTGTANADENRIQLSGSWGTLQLGDEDGAEDIMNYGGESLMGGTGGFDGDIGDVMETTLGGITAGPTIVGDSGDATKVSYYSPRFSGLQVGVSLTPAELSGNDKKLDTTFENGIGIGVNYNNSFGDVNIKVSGVYAKASAVNSATTNDVGSYAIGAVVGFGPFSIGGAWADNGDSA
ncbi:MAG: porin, partial [Alphaproteobacteria bacterium]